MYMQLVSIRQVNQEKSSKVNKLNLIQIAGTVIPMIVKIDHIKIE